jgi:hypothetical protein
LKRTSEALEKKKEVLMRTRLSFGTAIFAVVAFVTFDASALPISLVNPSGQVSPVIQIAGGCGIGWHRGPDGGCRPNFWRHPGWGTPRCWFRPNGRRVCHW